MSAPINDGGPAFPCDHLVDDDGVSLAPGMSLRDYFATRAMQAAATNPVGAEFTFEQRAEWAYRQADAMLKARAV